MKLTELVKYLLHPELLPDIYRKQNLNEESEVLLIYMKEPLDIESEISIFEIEETEGNLFFDKDGVAYVQLFALPHAIDLIESDLDLKGKGFSDLQIAERLLEYRKNDA
jgi:hypothetical protein